MTVTVQRWDGGEFRSGDSEIFHRSGEQWRLSGGEKVEKAEEAAN